MARLKDSEKEFIGALVRLGTPLAEADKHVDLWRKAQCAGGEVEDDKSVRMYIRALMDSPMGHTEYARARKAYADNIRIAERRSDGAAYDEAASKARLGRAMVDRTWELLEKRVAFLLANPDKNTKDYSDLVQVALRVVGRTGDQPQMDDEETERQLKLLGLSMDALRAQAKKPGPVEVTVLALVGEGGVT